MAPGMSGGIDRCLNVVRAGHHNPKHQGAHMYIGIGTAIIIVILLVIFL
jgi:pantothenate kinase type III